MITWSVIVQQVLEQISPLDGMKDRVFQAMMSKGGLFVDTGVESEDLGFCYYEWFDGGAPPECKPGEVYVAYFKDKISVNSGDFERFIHSWPWIRA